MSKPVCLIVLMTLSKETTCVPSPANASLAAATATKKVKILREKRPRALPALEDPMALRSMQGICTNPS